MPLFHLLLGFVLREDLLARAETETRLSLGGERVLPIAFALSSEVLFLDFVSSPGKLTKNL